MNSLLNTTEDLETRFDLRASFINFGLVELMKEIEGVVNKATISPLYSSVINEITGFYEQRDFDEEEFTQKHGRIALWDRLLARVVAFVFPFKVLLLIDMSSLVLI